MNDDKPLLGGKITISLSPASITLLAATIAVFITMFFGWVLLVSFGLPVHIHEMWATAIVSIFSGTLAALPLFLLMNRGIKAIIHSALLGIFIRVGSILTGLILVGCKAWGYERMPLIYWTLTFYFPLLISETSIIAWLSHKAKY